MQSEFIFINPFKRIMLMRISLKLMFPSETTAKWALLYVQMPIYLSLEAHEKNLFWWNLTSTDIPNRNEKLIVWTKFQMWTLNLKRSFMDGFLSPFIGLVDFWSYFIFLLTLFNSSKFAKSLHESTSKRNSLLWRYFRVLINILKTKTNTCY